MSGIAAPQPDMKLVLDAEGTIREITLSGAVGEEAVEGWRGRPWSETVDVTAGGKLRRMMDDARRNGVSGYCRFNQRFPSGIEIPVEFTAVRLGGQEGFLALGRSLDALAEVQSRLVAAQQAMEQDYWKLRELETRYRMLFEAVRDPVLTVRAESLRIAEANPAALRALGFGRGADLLGGMPPADRIALQAMLARIREHGKAPPVLMHLGMEQTPWRVRASLLGGELGPVFMLHLTPAGTPIATVGPDAMPIEDLIECLPDAFLVVEENGQIRHANQGFLDLVQVAAKGAVEGELLGRWLSHPGANAALLLATLRRQGTVRRFPTVLHGEYGTETKVEISAAVGTQERTRSAVMLIRDVGGGISFASHSAIAGAVPQQRALADLIASQPQLGLADIVAEAVALVERQCIITALERTRGNRTEAAGLLGISRQSLYKKVARYDIDADAPGTDAAADD